MEDFRVYLRIVTRYAVLNMYHHWKSALREEIEMGSVLTRSICKFVILDEHIYPEQVKAVSISTQVEWTL